MKTKSFDLVLLVKQVSSWNGPPPKGPYFRPSSLSLDHSWINCKIITIMLICYQSKLFQGINYNINTHSLSLHITWEGSLMFMLSFNIQKFIL